MDIYEPKIRIYLNCSQPASVYLRDLSIAGPNSTYLRCPDRCFGDSLGPGSCVPIVRAMLGYATLDSATFGRSYPNGAFEGLRECRGQSLGFPCCIPVSSLVIGHEGRCIDVADARGGNLWIAAVYHSVSEGGAMSVVPLVVESGPDLKDHCPVQPIFIPMEALPGPGVWAFISPYGAAHLRRPSSAGSLRLREVVAA